MLRSLLLALVVSGCSSPTATVCASPDTRAITEEALADWAHVTLFTYVMADTGCTLTVISSPLASPGDDAMALPSDQLVAWYDPQGTITFYQAALTDTHDHQLAIARHEVATF